MPAPLGDAGGVRERTLECTGGVPHPDTMAAASKARHASSTCLRLTSRRELTFTMLCYPRHELQRVEPYSQSIQMQLRLESVPGLSSDASATGQPLLPEG